MLNLNKILNKIWAEIVILIVSNYTKVDIKFKSDKIWDIKFIKNILIVMKKIKRFLNKEIIFLINIIFEK